VRREFIGFLTYAFSDKRVVISGFKVLKGFAYGITTGHKIENVNVGNIVIYRDNVIFLYAFNRTVSPFSLSVNHGVYRKTVAVGEFFGDRALDTRCVVFWVFKHLSATKAGGPTVFVV
jgi:hypothetical protein